MVSGPTLPRPAPGNASWTVCPVFLGELQSLTEQWGDYVSLEAVEAIALAVAARLGCPPPEAP